MKSLSPRRLWLTMRYMGSISWRADASVAVIAYLISIVILFLTAYGDDDPAGAIEALTLPYAFALSIFVSVRFTRMLIPGKGSSGQLQPMQLLLLPASNAEKVISSLIMNVGAPVLSFSVAFHLAVLTMFPTNILPILTRGSLTDYLFAQMSNGVADADAALATGISAFFIIGHVLCYSTYALGGMLFSRSRWLLTFLAIFLCLLGLPRAIVWLNDAIDFDEYQINFTAAVWWADSIGAALSALFIWLTYRLFKRRQVVKGAFLNV